MRSALKMVTRCRKYQQALPEAMEREIAKLLRDEGMFNRVEEIESTPYLAPELECREVFLLEHLEILGP